MVDLSPFPDIAFGDPESYRHQKAIRPIWMIPYHHAKTSWLNNRHSIQPVQNIAVFYRFPCKPIRETNGKPRL